MSVKELVNNLPQLGMVRSILIRKAKHQTPVLVDCVDTSPDFGLEGDHYGSVRSANAYQVRSNKRQVTLIQFEHIRVIASLLGLNELDAKTLRRNIVVSGINLLALKDREFLIGNTQLKMTGLCQPCSRMEEALGPGGFNAMRGHGGITAKIVVGGKIQINDSVKMLN